MDKLRALNYLMKVAETLNFSSAGKAFGVPASSISRRIADLESELGVDLLHRTTRTVRLTEVGALYLEQVRAGMANLREADELVGLRSSTPSGTLRISAMPSYGQALLLPVLQEFGERYPDIVLDIHLSDALVELGKQPYDIAVRGGLPPDERVVSYKLDANRFVLVASPGYLARAGQPASLLELASHRTLMYRGPNSLIRWLGLGPHGWRELDLAPAFVCNDGGALISMAIQHKGLALLPEWGISRQLADGRLVEVVLDAPVAVTRSKDAGIYLLYLRPRYQSPKVKLAVDFLIERLAKR